MTNESNGPFLAERPTFRKALEQIINTFSQENGSDTPDFLLADYLVDCLAAYDRTVTAREKWYGRPCGGGAAILASVETSPGAENSLIWVAPADAPPAP